MIKLKCQETASGFQGERYLEIGVVPKGGTVSFNWLMVLHAQSFVLTMQL